MSDKPAAEGAKKNEGDWVEMDGGDGGKRFQVNRVDSTAGGSAQADSREENTDLLTTHYNAQNQTYTYDTRYLRSLRHVTMEAFPKENHYRDLMSIARGGGSFRPTLDDLHGSTVREKPKSGVQPEDEDPSAKKGKVIKFGWLEGVFVSIMSRVSNYGDMRCLLNIWGVMLFLRLTWVVGQAGIGLGTAVILLCNLITFITAISMSAVSTNGQIKAGGIYYMISRSLGPEFGGAIGLMFTLSNSISCSMYIIGFCLSLQDLLKNEFNTRIIDDGPSDIRVVGVANTGCHSWNSTCWDGLGDEADVWNSNTAPDFVPSEGEQQDFFSVFAVFFPAVTGIVAGANLSGDLKDPGSAIPLGTLLAIGVTCVSYVGYGLMVGGSCMRRATGDVCDLYSGTDYACEGNATKPTLSIADYVNSNAFKCNATGDDACKFGLQFDNQAMAAMSAWEPLIYGGCFAATLSSAIASLVGAPRVFMALAKDRLYPGIHFFSVGYGANNDPVRAELNAVGTLTSNFFLAAYALINFSVFHASITKSPGWRPSFKFYNAWVALFGTVLCVATMFLINWTTALITFGITITLYLYVSYRKPEANWGSSNQAQTYNAALKAVHELDQLQEHVKNYRPQLLVLSGLPSTRPPLIDFANMITKHMSLMVVGQVIKGPVKQSVKNHYMRKAQAWFTRHKIRGFFNVIDEEDFEKGANALIQLAGIGRLKPNMLLLGFKADWRVAPKDELVYYVNTIHAAFDSYLAVGILRLKDGLDYSNMVENDEEESGQQKDEKALVYNLSADQLSQAGADDSPPASPKQSRSNNGVVELEKGKKSKKKRRSSVSELFRGPGGAELPENILHNLTRFRQKQPKGFIDVWWLYDDGGLTILIPYILNNRSQWRDCKLRIFSLASSKGELEQEQRSMAALLTKFRIDYSDVIVISDVQKKAQDSTKDYFNSLIQPFRETETTDNSASNPALVVSEAEMLSMRDKNNRHMRLRELLQHHSSAASLVVMTLPMPKKNTVSAPLYMAWLEMLTKDMPPFLILRGNQTSVLTFYS
ncbi:unnamed protein product [Notodromas monacha]|uniref:Uncharacterized protein n=1 Tax=Notodromas monacha TaxID=399045 RepID=A0A7R9BH81_9CRUS|nr:unnamed protein product [Notodromas monacha]CAG0914745.1 unnamed protein product [Notodromas monacha]